MDIKVHVSRPRRIYIFEANNEVLQQLSVVSDEGIPNDAQKLCPPLQSQL